MHSPMTSWTWKNQRSRCSHDPWGSTIPISPLPTKTQKDKVVRHLIPPPLSPTNIIGMGDHRFPDEISSVDQHLFRVKVLNPPVSSFDLTVMSDHQSPDGISSIDSILIRDFLRPCAFMSFLQVLDGRLRRVSLWGSLPRVLSEADKGITLPRTIREV